MSPRETTAECIAQFCIGAGLNEVYGSDVAKQSDQKGKSYYSITFCKARVLDGMVKVYSPTFILVKWQTAFRDMPHKGQEVFKCINDAIDFMKTSFVRG